MRYAMDALGKPKKSCMPHAPNYHLCLNDLNFFHVERGKLNHMYLVFKRLEMPKELNACGFCAVSQFKENLTNLKGNFSSQHQNISEAAIYVVRCLYF